MPGSAPLFIASGALGFDYWAAGTVLDLQQQLILALPFSGHEQRWNDQGRKELAALIQRTHAAGGEVRSISAPGYSPNKLTIRDHWIIDRAHAIIAGWDGGQQGGTWNAITYACNVQRPQPHDSHCGMDGKRTDVQAARHT